MTFTIERQLGTASDDLVLFDDVADNAPDCTTPEARSLGQAVLAQPAAVGAAPVPGSHVLQADPTRSRYERELLGLLSEHPVESGSYHPAEEPLQEWIRERGGEEFVAFWATQAGRKPGIAADLLRCLGVTKPTYLSEGWGHDLAQAALVHSSVDVRNAAVEALESWGDPRAREILGSTNEQVPWLRDYIGRVLRDLRE